MIAPPSPEAWLFENVLFVTVKEVLVSAVGNMEIAPPWLVPALLLVNVLPVTLRFPPTRRLIAPPGVLVATPLTAFVSNVQFVTV